MPATVSRTWYVTGTPLDEVDIEFFAEQIERSGDPDLRMSTNYGRAALNRATVLYFLREDDAPPYTYACVRHADGGGYYLSTPAGSFPLREMVKSRPARQDETPGEIW